MLPQGDSRQAETLKTGSVGRLVANKLGDPPDASSDSPFPSSPSCMFLQIFKISTPLGGSHGKDEPFGYGFGGPA